MKVFAEVICPGENGRSVIVIMNMDDTSRAIREWANNNDLLPCDDQWKPCRCSRGDPLGIEIIQWVDATPFMNNGIPCTEWLCDVVCPYQFAVLVFKTFHLFYRGLSRLVSWNMSLAR